MFRLQFETGDYMALRAHLLASAPREQAAFVYFVSEGAPRETTLSARQVELLTERDFIIREEDYIEVTDEARQRMIRTAHGSQLGVVEFHSHPFDLPAEFSHADYAGLRDTVPHMLWRLKRRPYGAVVVGPSDFDGLVWQSDQSVNQLDAIIDGSSELSPTRRSIRRWQLSI
jgi:hypothetical protein